jgi:peptidoglycan/xylan/chitin deacetylase (PgdA/CDA1 family)
MFKQHMAYLKQHHTVLPLAKVVDAIQSKTPLPSNTVVITFDDGYENILKNAHPIMVDMGFPYTIFINPGEIGTNRSQLTWAQVEAMHNDGVTFANHTLDHLHMLDGRVSSNGADSGTNDEAWLKKVWQNIAEAEAIIDSKIGESLKYLAYPFGEFNQKLADKLAQEGYIAFGQHSGAIGPHSNFQALPRFPAAGPYANLETLKTKLNSIAMPVLSTSFEGEHIPEVQGASDESRLPPITLTIKGDDVRLRQVNCFFSGSPVETRVEGNAVTFSIAQALPVGRSRVNCTAPSNSQSGRYYWYSQPFFVADKNGNYPD